jgi:ABC-type multidrug transport system fused ATPase/permease subunit
MQSSFRPRLPIVIFVITVAGVLALSWLAYRSTSARNAQLAAAQQLEIQRVQLQEQIAQLESRRSITKVEYEEQKVQVPEVTWRTRETYAYGLSTKYPEVRMQTKVIKVPKEVQADDPKVVEEIASARESLLAKGAAVDASLKDESLSAKLFGIRREIVAFVFSLVILLASLYVIINKKYQPNAEKWAFGSVGTILGYWLG